MPLLAAVMAAFGGVISEVGAVMMVGGNIKGQTEVLTTGIVTNVSMGLFASAVALAMVLIILSFTTNYAMTIIQQPGSRRAAGVTDSRPDPSKAATSPSSGAARRSCTSTASRSSPARCTCCWGRTAPARRP